MSLGTLTAMVAHEMNNMLTPIVNYAHLAKKQPSFTEKAIDRAIDCGERAAHICHSILGFTRDDSRACEPVELGRVVEEALTTMARDPRKDSIELDVSIPGDLTVNSNRIELQQVVLNLVMNARAALLQRPGLRQIRISADQADREVCLQVWDSGEGIDEHHLDDIFKPFFTTREKGVHGSGFGLGLAISKDIIESMGGRIHVHSTPGQETTFSVYLPVSDGKTVSH